MTALRNFAPSLTDDLSPMAREQDAAAEAGKSGAILRLDRMVMPTLDQAQRLIAEHVQPLSSEQLAFDDASGRVLAAPLFARRAAPLRDCAAMDGYAVADATTEPMLALDIIGESRAGCPFPGTVGRGQAVRIFTGALLPPGADRVIVQEQADQSGKSVRFKPGYGPKWHVRRAGSDFVAGALLVAGGRRLCPRTLVTAAAADQDSVLVARRPNVTIIATGDELRPVGHAHHEDFAIPDSVSPGIRALVECSGGTVARHVRAADHLPTLQHISSHALTDSDLTIVIGGASLGDHDHGKAMFAPHALHPLFDCVAMKPGKPVWLGRVEGKWVLGLPGNPTAAMVTARLLLVPILEQLQGLANACDVLWQPLPLATSMPQNDQRETFVRAQWIEDGLLPLDCQDSAGQMGLQHADWLIRRPAHAASLAAGAIVRALPF